MPLRPLTPLVLACASAVWPSMARADVRRCETPDGQVIFTDRKCEEVHAEERPPRSEAAAGAQLHRRGGCLHTWQDLVFEMTGAIDGRDANRLAAVYHWPGTSGEAGYRIWARLDAIANWPLVDIVPVMPATPPPSDSPTSDSAGSDAATATQDQVDPDFYPQTAVRRSPVALRVEQTLGSSATPVRTVFGLTRYFGCWWVRFR